MLSSKPEFDLDTGTINISQHLKIPVSRSSSHATEIMSLTNVYHLRRVADTAAKSCLICYKPSTSVLITPENKDFFYVCPAHLQDRHFCTPIIDTEGEAKRQKEEAMAKEIENVKKEYEEKQRRKKEKAKDENDKEKDDSKEKDKDTSNSKSDEKERDDKDFLSNAD
ncbi:hypothetical protein N7478_006908 [Penicillium angulare]|uniref:uncharacterized protein n=1 Tax=Penicillium angulare TaxID=116970 RepID=UPI0025418227|nr:uncharacterized protein N7478_006908 [Penicillium angulare]KAJ5281536.1 hypothetical protein N7478_006908 [Penicillium angulare]